MFQVNARTNPYSGLAAAAPLFSFRWGDATHKAIIQYVGVGMMTTTAATATGVSERELIIARAFTASDTGGTAISLSGNNQKMITSEPTSLVTDIRIGSGVTPGTRTLDANPIASAISFTPLSFTGLTIGGNGAGPFVTGQVWSNAGGSSNGYAPLLNAIHGPDYPITLVQNEGFIIRIGKDAMPASAVQQTYISIAWIEVN